MRGNITPVPLAQRDQLKDLFSNRSRTLTHDVSI